MQSAIPNSRSSRVESEFNRIGALLARGEFQQALGSAEKLCAEANDDRDALYILAVSQRCAGRHADALATLDRLQRHHRHFSRLFEERGHCLVALRAPQPAVESYLHAVRLDSCLPQSWGALEALHRAAGRTQAADDAARQVARISALPPEIRLAHERFALGEYAAAEELLRRYLESHGEHVEGMRLLAKIAVEFGAPYDAEMLLQRVLTLAPTHRLARAEYARVLLDRQRHEPALRETGALLAVDPTDPVARAMQAAAWAGLGRYDEALPLYRALLEEMPAAPELHLSMGHARKALGETQEAIECYRRAAVLEQRRGEAYWSLANLKTYRFTDQELAGMEALDADGATDAAQRIHACFALAKGLEDRGQHAEAFRLYARGNSLKRAELRYRPEVLERTVNLETALCTRQFFESRRDHGSDSDAPIFIVGLPRSGSTLIEQILASHPSVEGTMELPEIPRLVQELQSSNLAGGSARPGYPRILSELSAEDCRELGRRYLRDTEPYRRGRRHFIDKMPNNFRHIGLIALLLPNARIIDARREPMACCVGIFKQLFAAGQRFAYRLEDIARYYRLYVESMAHWDEALPGKILRVQHESLVDDFEPNVRRLLDFCGLEFHPACLEFHRTRRTVHSASSEQVHQPLNREGIDAWRHFEPWLAPLRQSLAGAPAASS